MAFKILFAYLFIKILEREQFGKCSDYKAIPGFGLQCNISGVENLIKEKRRLSTDDVISTTSDGEGIISLLIFAERNSFTFERKKGF